MTEVVEVTGPDAVAVEQTTVTVVEAPGQVVSIPSLSVNVVESSTGVTEVIEVGYSQPAGSGGSGAVDSVNGLTGNVITRFTQAFTRQSSLAVTHNLSCFPSVTVVNTANDVVVGDVAYTDTNSLTVTFDGVNSGTIYCN